MLRILFEPVSIASRFGFEVDASFTEATDACLVAMNSFSTCLKVLLKLDSRLEIPSSQRYYDMDGKITSSGIA